MFLETLPHDGVIYSSGGHPSTPLSGVFVKGRTCVCIVETISLGKKPVLLWGSGEMVDNPSSLFERAGVRRKLTINAIRNMKQDTAGGLIGGKNGRPSVRL